MKTDRIRWISLRKEVLLFSLPLFFLLLVCPTLSSMDHYLNEITAQVLFYIVLCGCCISIFIREESFRLGWADGGVLLFTGWYLVRIVFSGLPLDRWTILSVAAGLLLYFQQRNNRTFQPFWWLLFGAGIVQSIWFLLQFQGICASYNPHFKGTGSFNNPAILAVFLVSSFFAGVYLFKYSCGKYLKWGILVGMALMFYCIAQTGSRASWIALLAGSLWMFWPEVKHLLCRYSKAWSRRGKITGCIVGAFISVVGLFFLLSFLYSLRPESANGRLLIWQIVVNLWKQAPWVGGYSFQSCYMSMQAEWFCLYPDSVGVVTADNNIHTFNELLRIACESGVIGLLLFLGLIGYVCFKAFWGNLEARSAGAILVVLFIFGCFSYPGSIVWLVLMALVLIAVVANETEKSVLLSFSSGWLKYVVSACVAGMALFGVMEYRFEKKADLFLSGIQHDTSRLKGPEGCKYASRLSGNPDFMLCYARTLYNNFLYQEALPILEQAFRLKPSSQMVCDWGVCYERSGLYREAENMYLLASRMVPGYILPRYYLFDLYRKVNQPEKAEEMARELLVMPVKVVNTTVLQVRAEAKKFLKLK